MGQMKSQKQDLIGETIGHIRLVDVLGHGGMGTVYVGQDERLQREVAVKAIHGDHRLHREAKARFRREARILSQMNHRNICAVHEFIEDEGSDFLVLELVPGRSLRAAMKTQLAERQKLRIAEQLLEVLVAVHGMGVIHRDLKPENIMVKPDGEIAVLDFGLARSVDEEIAVFSETPTIDFADLGHQGKSPEGMRRPAGRLSTHVKTNRGTIVGSAGYMSPEQARAEPATAASDMYSAGLILQELFTGSPPFEPGLGPMGLVLKAAEGETRPVAAVPADLRALIERLKSFAPGARPSSVDALAQLRRIVERPRRRRRRAMAAAVWLALAILAGGMTIQWARASREAKRANREAVAAQQVSDFLVNLFEESNPEQARGASLSAEEILQRGAERISGTLEEQPLTRAKLVTTIAKVYHRMGLYPEAVSLLEDALDIRKQQLGDDSASVAFTMFRLGTYKGNAGDLAGAVADLEAALELQEQIHGSDSTRVADTLTNLAAVCNKSGRFDDGESLLRRALPIYETHLGPDDLKVATILANLGISAALQKRPDEAGPYFERALAIHEEKLGVDHPNVLKLRFNLAANLMERGKLDEAERQYKLNLEIQERVLGEEHPDLGKVHQNYANLLVELDRQDEAEQHYLRSLEISRAALGPDHPEVGLGLSNLGELYLKQGRLDEAETLCLEALAIQEAAQGQEHPGVGFTMLTLARISSQLGRLEEANRRYERSVGVFRTAFSPDHPKAIETETEYADFLREQGRELEAEELEARAAAMRSAHTAKNSSEAETG